MKSQRNGPARTSGNVLVLALLVLTLLALFSGAQYSLLHSDIRQSNSFVTRSVLRRYAECGVDIALHDRKFFLTGRDGAIGTYLWTNSDDVGRDGVPSTGDQGESDGVPTPGEPNVFPALIGQQASLVTHVQDTTDPEIKRIVSTAALGEQLVSVEWTFRETVITLPRVGALFLSATALLDLVGNGFLVDGRNHNKSGTLQDTGHKYAISTPKKDGINRGRLLQMIKDEHLDQLLGVEETEDTTISPSVINGSVGEVSDVDFTTVFEMYRSIYMTELVSGEVYSSLTMGDASANDYEVTYIQGDLKLSGTTTGAGVLVVDGNLDITGSFHYTGLILVNGDMSVRGGGSNVVVIGTIMLANLMNAIDPDLSASIGGSASFNYSSDVMDELETYLPAKGITLLSYRSR